MRQTLCEAVCVIRLFGDEPWFHYMLTYLLISRMYGVGASEHAAASSTHTASKQVSSVCSSHREPMFRIQKGSFLCATVRHIEGDA